MAYCKPKLKSLLRWHVENDVVHFRVEGTSLKHLASQAQATFETDNLDDLLVLPSLMPDYQFRLERRRTTAHIA